jgi:hypothetical protein
MLDAVQAGARLDSSGVRILDAFQSIKPVNKVKCLSLQVVPDSRHNHLQRVRDLSDFRQDAKALFSGRV